MRLSPARFNAFLGAGGSVTQKFFWRRRSACPCVAESSGQARFDCPICGGKGNIYAAEVPGWAGMTNQTPQKAQAIFGSWEPGDCVITIPSNSPLYGARRFDRIRADDSTNPFSEVIRPGLNDRVQGKIKSIDRVLWIDPNDNTKIIEGGIPTVAADGSLSWTSGAPPAGVNYTIEGVRYDEFFVWHPLASDRNSGISGLPLKLAARVYDLMGR